MNLHRTSGKPDWAGADESDYNPWQSMAARTHGIVTPANAISMIGFAVVLYGLASIAQHRFWLGVILLLSGRLADIADGWVAEATATKSPLGEVLDVTIDKLGTALMIIVLFVSRTAPWWALLVLLAPQIIISLITAYHVHIKIPIHPSRVGKLSMLATWVSLLGLIILRAVDTAPRSALEVVVYGVLFISATMAMYAAVGYALQKD